MVLQNELKDASRIPLKDRLAWTIPQAASLYGIDYDGLRQAVNQGDIDTFRPPSKRGTPSRRHTRGNGPIRQIVGGVSMNNIRKEL